MTIKYRAWHKKIRKMLKVDALNFKNKTALLGIETTEIYGDDAYYWNQSEVSFNEIELMKCTGLKDKFGNEIYEGDIVRQEYEIYRSNWDYGSYSGEHIGEVVMIASRGACLKKPLIYPDEEGIARRTTQYKSIAGYRAEVIGNIYENPDIVI